MGSPPAPRGQSPGRPLRWMATSSERANRTPPTGRLTVIRPLTKNFIRTIPPQTAARPQDQASSRRLRESGARIRATDAHRCRGSRWRWRAQVGDRFPISDQEAGVVVPKVVKARPGAQTGPRHRGRQTRSENLLRRSGSPWSPLKTVRRSPGSHSARLERAPDKSPAALSHGPAFNHSLIKAGGIPEYRAASTLDLRHQPTNGPTRSTLPNAASAD
jgi:hypothetical protein